MVDLMQAGMTVGASTAQHSTAQRGVVWCVGDAGQGEARQGEAREGGAV